MRKLLSGIAAVLATVCAAGAAHAQIPHITPFSFEARGGAAIPTGDLKQLANPGYSLGASVTYHAFPTVGIYGGVSQARLDGKGEGGSYNDRGGELGVRVGIPTPLIPIDPWIKGGLLWHKISSSGFTDPNLNQDSDFKTGVEVGAGLGFGFGPISITPGVTWMHHATEGTAKVDMVKAEVGVRIHL